MTHMTYSYFGQLLVFKGIRRKLPDLKLIGCIKNFLEIQEEAQSIIIHFGRSHDNIMRCYYELLLLKFGGKYYNNITIASFLDLNSINSVYRKPIDVNYIHLPNLEIMNISQDPVLIEYESLLNEEEILENFDHGVKNKVFNREYCLKLEQNIINYGRT